MEEGKGITGLDDETGDLVLDEGVGLDDRAGGVDFEVGSIGVFEEGIGSVHLELDIGGVGVFVDRQVGTEMEGRIKLVDFVVGRIVDRVGKYLDVDTFSGSEKVGSTVLVGMIEGMDTVRTEVDKDGRTMLVGFTDGRPTDVEIFPSGIDKDGNAMLVGFAEEG